MADTLTPPNLEEAIIQSDLGNIDSVPLNDLAELSAYKFFGPIGYQNVSTPANLNAAVQARQKLNEYYNNLLKADSASFVSPDTAKNFTKGVATGLVDLVGGTEQLVNKLTPDTNGGKTHQAFQQKVAELEQDINNNMDRNLSTETLAARQAYQFKQAADARASQAKYERDISQGVDDTTAKLAREGRNAVNSMKNAWNTKQFKESVSTNTGTWIPALAGTKGFSLTGSAIREGTGYLASRAVAKYEGVRKLAKAAEAVTNAPLTRTIAEKFKDAAPWMLSNALMEGGGTASSIYEAAEGISIDDLYEKSPEFMETLMSKIQQLSPEEQNNPDLLEKLEQETKQELVNKAVDEAFNQHAITAGAASYFTKGLGKWASPSEMASNRLAKALGESVTDTALDTLLEEPVTEVSAVVAPNQAIQRHLDSSKDTWEGSGEAAGQAVVSTAGIGAMHTGASAVSSAAGMGVEKISQAKQERQERQELQGLANQSASIADMLDPSASGMVDVGKTLGDTRKRIQSKYATDANGKTQTKEFANYKQDLEDLKKEKEAVENSKIKQGLSEKDTQTVENYKQALISKIDGLIGETQQKIHAPLQEVMKKMQEVPEGQEYTLTEQDNQALTNSLSILDENDRDQYLHEAGFTKNQLTSLSQSKAATANPEVKKSVDDYIQNMGTVTRGSPIPGGPTPAPTPTPTPAPPKNAPGRTYYAMSDVSRLGSGVHTFAVDTSNPSDPALVVPFPDANGSLTRKTVAISSVPDSPEKQAFVKAFTDPNATKEVKFNATRAIIQKYFPGSDIYQDPSRFDPANTTNDSFEVSSNGQNFVMGVTSSEGNSFVWDGAMYTPLDSATAKIFADPTKTDDDKRAAFENWLYTQIPTLKGNAQVKLASVRHAINLLYSDKISEAQHGVNLLRAHNKTVSVNQDGELEIQDLDTAEKNKEVTEKLGKLGDKVEIVKRNLYLMGKDAPFAVLKNLLANPEKLQELLKANKVTNIKSLMRKLFTRNGEEIPTDFERTFIDKNASLASQILSMLNPEGQFMKTFMPLLETSLKESEALKGIVTDEEGNVKEEFKQYMAIVATHWLASIDTRRNPLTEDMARKYNIDPNENSELLKNAGVHGYLAPAALIDLADNLQRMMGVTVKNDANPEEVSAIFGEMAGRICDSLIDAGIIEDNKQVATVVTYDTETFKEKSEPMDVHFLKIKNQDYSHLFRNSADILHALLNPKMQNVVHYTPPQVNDSIVGTPARAGDSAKEPLKKANNTVHTVNPLMTKLALALGATGLSRLLHPTPNGTKKRIYSTGKSFDNNEGRTLTSQLGLDTISAIIEDRPEGTSVADTKVYFDNRVIKNGRIYQQGAATYQSNPLLRYCLMVTDNKAVNLQSDKDALNAWKITLAQKLGQNVSGNYLSAYEAQVDHAIDFMKNLPEPVKKLLEKINAIDLDKGQVDALSESDIDILQDFINSFNEDQQKAFGDKGYAVGKEESINALLEMYRYHTEDKANFVPHIFLEIDGISDGPAYINRLFGIAVTAITPDFIRTLAETGFIPFIKATSQDLLTEGTVESKLFGTGGFNLHAKVGASLAEMFRQRVDSLKKSVNESKDEQFHNQSQRALKSTISALKLLEIVGLLSGDIQKFVGGDTKAIKFHKNISKKLSTIILYGSGLRGTTNQVIDMIFDGAYGKDGIYGKLSNILSKLGKNYKNPEEKAKATKEALAEYRKIRKALMDVFSTNVEKDMDFGSGTYSYSFTESELGNYLSKYSRELQEDESLSVRPEKLAKIEDEISDLMGKFVTAMPAKLDASTNWDNLKDTKKGVASKDDTGNYTITKDKIQNFALTEAGRSALVEALMPVFGEPAYAAVVDAVGADALTAAKTPQIFGSLSNGISRMADILNKRNTKGEKQSRRFFLNQYRLNGLAPNITFRGGATIIAERHKYVPSAKPIFKGKHEASTFYRSEDQLDDIGVAFGALATQGLGDTATAYHLLRSTDGVFGQVFDGMYTAITKLAEISEAANEGAKNASNQRPIAQIMAKINSIGKQLKKVERYSKYEPQQAFSHAVADMVNGILPDGTKLSKEEQALFRDTQYLMTRSLTQYIRNVTFDPSIFAGRKIIFSNNQTTEIGIATKIRNLVDDFFDFVSCMVINEKVNHEVFDHLPQSFHHMSGANTPFTQGNVLEGAKGQELLDNVNKKLKLINGTPFKDLTELIAAYCATEAGKVAEKLLKKDELQKWQYLSKRVRGNDHVRTLPDDIQDFITTEIGGTVKHTNTADYTPKYAKNTELPRGTVVNAVLAVGNLFNAGSVFRNILQKLTQVIPQNVPVYMYSRVIDMPEEVRGKFTPKHEGIFFNGAIHILDQSGNNNANDMRNQKVIVHELMHAVLTKKIKAWADGDKTLPVATRMALDNLDAMIQDLFSNPTFAQKAPPAILQKFKEIVDVKDKAERLDEALAHIISNHELYAAISQVGFTPDQIKKHRFSLWNVFSKIKDLLGAAVTAWKRLLGIASGTPMDQILDLELKGKNFDKYKNLQDFLSIYGMNTLVLLDNPKGEKKETKEEFKTKNEKAFEEAQKTAETGEIRASLKLTPDEGLNTGLMGYITGQGEVVDYINKSELDQFFENVAAHPGEPKYWWKDIQANAFNKQATEFNKANLYTQEATRILSNIADVVNPEEVAKLLTDFQKDSFFTPDQRKELTQNYNQVLEHLTPDFLVKGKENPTHEEIDRSAKIYSLLTGSDPVLKTLDAMEQPDFFVKDREGPTFKKQAVFYALAYGNPDINIALGKVNIEPGKIEVNQPEKTFARVLEKAGNMLLKVLQAKTKEAESTKKLLEGYEGLNKELPTSALYNMVEKLTEPIDSVTMHVMLSPFLLARGVSFKDLNRLIRKLRKSPALANQFTSEFLRDLTNKLPVTATEFLQDFYGRTPSNTAAQSMLKSIKGFIDKTRKANLDNIPQELIKSFKRKLKLKNKKLLHKVITATKACLLDFNKAIEFITDTTKLNDEIQKLEQKILTNETVLGKTYLDKTRQLANFNMGTGIAGQNLLVNPEAIAHLWDEENAPRYNIESPKQELINDIKTLLIYYQLQYLTKGDRLEIEDYFKNDRAGLEKSFNSAKETLHIEEERVKALSDKSWVFNYRFNWFPKGNVPRGSYRLVPESKIEEYKSKGYKDLGIIPGSTIEGEPIHRVYDAWNNIKDVQEGIIQCINQTAFGWQLVKNGSNEFAGATILDPTLVSRIQRKAIEQGDKFNYIPIRNSSGKTIGYERVIPKADREDYVDSANDIFSGIAQYRARQDRETLAKDIMIDAGKILKDDYDNASERDKKTAFEDIFNSKNKQIQRAVARFDYKTKQRLEKIFGKGHCYIRKDLVWTFVGYNKMSLGDTWDGNFILGKEASRIVCKVLDSFVPNGKARAYLTRAESLMMGAATWARETIIIRSGIVPLMNAVGNVFNLMAALKMPPNVLWKLFRECYTDTETYNRLRDKEMALSTELLSTVDPKKQQELKSQIEKIQLEYRNLPIYPLIEAGEYSTIDSNGTTYESIELIKQKANNWLEAVTNDKIPAPLKTLTKNVLMTKDSEVFQALAKLTNYGDWLAKAVGYRYLTEKSAYTKRPLKPEIARNMVATLFVDYDQFVGPIRDWMNRIGITWFMTFTMRMITACQLSMLINPGAVVLGSIFQSATGLPGTPLTDNFFSKLVTGRLGSAFGLDMMFRSISLHPLAALLGL